MMRLQPSYLLGLCLLAFAVPADVSAQADRESAAVQSPSDANQVDALPAVFEGVGITEQLGQRIPLDLVFRDESGAEARLADYFESGRPVILNFVYHSCPMLCSILLESFSKTLRDMDWAPGQEFDVLTVSFSADESPTLAAGQKERYVEIVGREKAESGWHFLTGSEENIQSLAQATGFSFRWIEATKEFAHPAALIFLGSEGQITRYIHGMYFPVSDVRKAVVEASEGRIGSTTDRILMYCYRYDSTANSYVLHATNLMKLGGLLTLLVLGLGLFLFWKREHQRQAHTASAA